MSRMLWPTQLLDRPGEHVGERPVGVEDRRVVEAHEGHAGRRRVERLLEAPPRLLEGAHALLALGDVAQTDDDAGVGLARPVDGRLDERRQRAVDVRQVERHRRGRAIGAPRRQPAGEVAAAGLVDELGERDADERRHRQPGELGGLGVGAAHDTVGVERDDRFGEVVEQQAQLGLGVDQALDRAVEVAVDAPRLEPRDDDRARREHGSDDGGDEGARRAVVDEADDDDHEADEQHRGDPDRQHPAPHRRAPPDGDPVRDVLTHRLPRPLEDSLPRLSRCGWRRPASGRTLDLTLQARCGRGPKRSLPCRSCSRTSRRPGLIPPADP